jgi:hypothetical protein
MNVVEIVFKVTELGHCFYHNYVAVPHFRGDNVASPHRNTFQNAMYSFMFPPYFFPHSLTIFLTPQFSLYPHLSSLYLYFLFHYFSHYLPVSLIRSLSLFSGLRFITAAKTRLLCCDRMCLGYLPWRPECAIVYHGGLFYFETLFYMYGGGIPSNSFLFVFPDKSKT